MKHNTFKLRCLLLFFWNTCKPLFTVLFIFYWNKDHFTLFPVIGFLPKMRDEKKKIANAISVKLFDTNLRGKKGDFLILKTKTDFN